MVVSFSDSSGSIVQIFDSLTPQQMRERGSLKWSQYPGDVIGAWVAEMDLGTAPAVEEAIHRAVHTGLLGYMPPSVSREVREETARYQRETFGWQVEAEQVSLLPDVLSSLSVIIAVHTREGSPIIVPTPAYMPFLEIPGRNGRDCVEVPSVHGTQDGSPRWMLDLDGVESAMAAGAGLLVLCNPWNPAGRCLTRGELERLARIVDAAGGRVFEDCVHLPLLLDGAEAAVYGVPVIIGPNNKKFTEAQALLANGGCREITSAADFDKLLDDYLAHPAHAASAGAEAGNYIAEHAGATDKIYHHIFG